MEAGGRVRVSRSHGQSRDDLLVGSVLEPEQPRPKVELVGQQALNRNLCHVARNLQIARAVGRRNLAVCVGCKLGEVGSRKLPDGLQFRA